MSRTQNFKTLNDGKESLFEGRSLVEFARHANVIGSDADRAARLDASLEFEIVRSLAHWRSVMEGIEPGRPLSDDDFERLPNPEVEVNALVYSRAIDALLRINRASEVVRADIIRLLGPLHPRGAEGRARAQEEALRPLGRTRYAVAKAAGYDPSQFNKDLHAGVIRWLDLET